VGDFTGWLGRKGEEDGKTLSDMIQTISLITMLDKDDAELDQVQLATLHASKGLEFKHVFLVGVEEACCPTSLHRRGQDRGGAPPDVRGHHPRPAQPQHQLLRTPQGRPRGAHLRPVALHRRDGHGGHPPRRQKSQEPVSKEDAKARIANLRAMLGNKPGTIG
jgi:ATP-dependent DNA helicase Rep